MSLRVWLPLIKDTQNHGLMELPTPWAVWSKNEGGKIGQYCYSDCAIYHKEEEWLDNKWSLSCWVKSSNWGTYNDILMCKNTSESSQSQFYFSIIGGTTLNLGTNGGSGGVSYNYTFSTNTWYHVTATYDGTIACLYINGEKVKTQSYPTAKLNGMNNFCIGCCSSNAAGTSATGNGSKNFNDVRVYDHVLSPLEVKHIAQGLILHYPLNRGGWGQENLLKNSNDLTLWNKESGVNCEYDLTVKMYKVFSTTRESSRWGIYQDYSVSVDVDTEYTFSLTGKTDGFRSYLSFGAGSSWPTNYTAFDNNKQRLSKTLTIPAGTTNIRVYLAMYPTTGGGYTYFEKPKLEIGNKATPWCPNSSDELATTLGMNNNIEYDCSGFCNNGEYYAYDTNGSISYTSDTPKYNVSTRIASANPTQSAASGTRYLYGHCKLTNPTQMSVAFWLKPITGGYGSTTSNGQGYFCTTNYEYGDTSVGVDYQASAMNHRDGAVDMNDSASTTQCRVTFYPTIGEWHHYVYTYDGQVGRGYKDGVQTATAQFSAAKTLDSFIGVVIGFSKAGGVWRRNDACYSDFRVYATALSAEDVKKLNELGATIDTNGVLSTYEFTEQ